MVESNFEEETISMWDHFEEGKVNNVLFIVSILFIVATINLLMHVFYDFFIQKPRKSIHES